MSISIELLQELPSMEEATLAAADCCWSSVFDGCQWWSVTVSSCHSCTNTGS